MTFCCVMVATVYRVMTLVGVGAVTVTAAPVALPEMTVTAGGVMVAVVSNVTPTVAVEVTTMVSVILLYDVSISQRQSRVEPYVGYAAVSVAFTVTIGSSGARLAICISATSIRSFLARKNSSLSNSTIRPLMRHFRNLLELLTTGAETALDEGVSEVAACAIIAWISAACGPFKFGNLKRSFGSLVGCLAGTVHVGVTIFVVLNTCTVGFPTFTVAMVLVVVVVTRCGITVFVEMIVVEAAYTVDAGRVIFEFTSMIVAKGVS
jgi:hypothetical protein